VKNITLRGYGHPGVTANEMYGWLMKYLAPLAPYICDKAEYLSSAIDGGRSVMFEAQSARCAISIRNSSLHHLV
jgi:adenylosuccinate synthase